MKLSDAKDGVRVSRGSLSGTLRRGVNGWDVQLTNGQTMQGIDLSEWSTPKRMTTWPSRSNPSIRGS